MRLPLVIAAIIGAAWLATPAHAAGGTGAKPGNPRKLGLSIRVEGGGWGSAAREDIEAVLYSVAQVLLGQFPQLKAPIVVSHTSSNPVALYERGAGGEYQIHLHAHDRRWAQYAYEFSHELCHVLSNFENNAGHEARKHNQWFEEALCETASLYTLRRLALAWDEAPPVPELRAQAAHLGKLADRLMGQSHRRLPTGMTLAAWLRDNEGGMRADPYLRDKNDLVANVLLPLFESDPAGWAALGYLNLGGADSTADLGGYLEAWRASAPAAHRPFIAAVQSALGATGQADAPAGPPATAEKLELSLK